MDQRWKFIAEVLDNKASMSAVCRVFGISRQTGHKWLRRYKEERSVEEKSRRPRSHPDTTPRALVKRILSMKRQFPRWGPMKLRKRLRDQWPETRWPAVSTIGAILKRHGMVRPRRKRLRVVARTRPFSHCREANDVWCVDFKGQFEMGNGKLCYPLTVMDGASRFLLAVVGFHNPTLENVRSVFVSG